MKHFNTKIRFGLSLFWECFSIFSRFTDIQYNVSFCEQDVILLRPHIYYKMLLNFLEKELTQFPNVFLSNNIPLQDNAPESIYHMSCNLTNNNNATYLYNPPVNPDKFLIEALDNNKYVVINTKLVLHGDLSYWNNFKSYLKSFLNKHNITVVLIGEKSCMECVEYTIHNSISIYQDLLKEFNNVIDLTVNDTLDLYNPDIINRNISILQHSLFNIHFGHGGGQSVFSFLNHLITPATSRDLWYLDKFKSYHKIFVTPTLEQFKLNLDELLYTNDKV